MNIYLIEDYVKRLNITDVERFALNQGIVLEKEELEVVYKYIKTEYKTIIYGNPREILTNIKSKVKPLTYNKIENLYERFKDKIDIFYKTIRNR